MTIDYRYNEDELIREITQYIDSTYTEHYSQNRYQATEFIIDGGHGIGFTVGNILKYAQRYGHKGTADDWRKDLLKVIHYAIIALHAHKEKHSNENRTPVWDPRSGAYLMKTFKSTINIETPLTFKEKTSIVTEPNNFNTEE